MKVKQLSWGINYTTNPITHYGHTLDTGMPMYVVRGSRWWRGYNGPIDGFVYVTDSEKESLAAAQEDFEYRILGVLEVDYEGSA